MRFPADMIINQGMKARRAHWAKKDFVMAEKDKFCFIAYGAVKYKYTLTPEDAQATDWQFCGMVEK